MLLITGGHVSNGGAGEGVQRSFLRRSRKLQVRTIVPLGPKRSPRGKNTEGGIFRAGRNLESRRYFQVNGVFLVGGGGRERGEVGRQGGRGRSGGGWGGRGVVFFCFGFGLSYILVYGVQHGTLLLLLLLLLFFRLF